jgi:cytochrome c553
VLVAMLAVAAGIVFVRSQQQIARIYDVRPRVPPIPTDSASLARGEHLVRTVAKCVDCHDRDLGGSVFYASLPFGLFPAPNLTRGRGSAVREYADVDWVRAIRHGIGPDGRPLPFMPSDAYVWLTDADLGAIIAWLRLLPPVDRESPATRYGPISRMLLATGKLPLFHAATIDHSRQGMPAAVPGVTAAYGQYLARTGGCASCHGDGFAGGITAAPGSPPSANLTPTGLAGWTEADFFRVLREGKRPDGRALDDRYMPWRASGGMTDDEIRAIWVFLRGLPVSPTPAR